jgi:predicted O-methyltransferase YrrM
MNLSFDYFNYLYSKYYFELIIQRRIQQSRITQNDFDPCFDDFESELLYMTVREFTPDYSIEFSPYKGYSTTWILSALKKNNRGRLTSFDIEDNSYNGIRNCNLTEKWDLKVEDVIINFPKMPFDKIDFALIDSDHSREFTKKYIDGFLYPLHKEAIIQNKVVPIITHDIFWEGTNPTEEGEEVLDFLKHINRDYLTASKFFSDHQKIIKLREHYGINGKLHEPDSNPSIFFFLGV